MADLITEADVTARNPNLTAAQIARLPALIADASALARFEAKNDFEAVADDVIVLRANAGKLVLPNPPITAVSQVKATGLVGQPAGMILPAGSWTFDGIDTVTIHGDAGWIINLPADWSESTAGTFEVTYDHGGAIDDVLVATVARMVLRCVTSPSQAEGVTGENIGQYSYQMSQQLGTAGAGIIVTAADRAVFRNPRYRRTVRTIETPIG